MGSTTPFHLVNNGVESRKKDEGNGDVVIFYLYHDTINIHLVIVSMTIVTIVEYIEGVYSSFWLNL